MSYQFYRFLHIVGAFLVIAPLGGIALHMMNGGARSFPHRKLMATLHGTGMLILLVAGFGALAKLGIMASMPAWVFVKIGIWLVLGVMPLFLYRKASLAKTLFFGILLLGALAVATAEYKPSLAGNSSEPGPGVMPAPPDTSTHHHGNHSGADSQGGATEPAGAEETHSHDHSHPAGSGHEGHNH